MCRSVSVGRANICVAPDSSFVHDWSDQSSWSLNEVVLRNKFGNQLSASRDLGSI